MPEIQRPHGPTPQPDLESSTMPRPEPVLPTQLTQLGSVVPDRIDAARETLRRAIGTAKAEGIPIQVNSGMDLEDKNWTLIVPSGENEIKMRRNQIPQEPTLPSEAMTKQLFNRGALIAPELRATPTDPSSPVKFNPFSLDVTPTEDNIRVRVYDHLSSSDPIVLDRTFPAEKRGEIWDAIRPEIISELERRAPLHKEEIGRIPPEAHYELREAKGSVTSEQQSSLDILKRMDDVTVAVYRRGEDLSQTELERELHKIEKNGIMSLSAPLEAQGLVRWVSLTEAITVVGVNEQEKSVTFRTSAGSEITRPLESERMDRDGNTIVESFTLGEGDLPRAGWHYVTVEPKFPLSRPGDPAVAKITADLTLEGIGKIDTLVNQPAIPRVAERNGYGLYSSISEPSTRRFSESGFRHATEGISAAESLFGGVGGSLVSNIFLYTDDHNPGFAGKADMWNISLGSVVIEANRNVELIARHEAFHCLDARFGISAQGNLEKVFNELKNDSSQKFFEQVDESNFHGSRGLGHSRDHMKELFATFSNSLISARWTEIMKGKTPEFRATYGEVLDAYRKDLEQSDAPRNATIFRLVDERQRQLEQLD